MMVVVMVNSMPQMMLEFALPSEFFEPMVRWLKLAVVHNWYRVGACRGGHVGARDEQVFERFHVRGRHRLGADQFLVWHNLGHDMVVTISARPFLRLDVEHSAFAWATAATVDPRLVKIFLSVTTMFGCPDAWNDRVDDVRVDLFELHRAGRRCGSFTTILFLLEARLQHFLYAGELRLWDPFPPNRLLY